MPSPNLMAAAASQITNRMKLLIYGNSLPVHEPLRLAEELAMLDCLTDGRLISGFVRGIPREYVAYGVDQGESRARFNEAWEIIKLAWSEESFSYKGDFWTYNDVAIWPRPVQQPRIPIWVGGESKAALRRTVTHGDAWYPVGSNPQFPLNTTARYSEALERLYRVADEHNRDPASIKLAYWAHWPNDGEPIVLSDGQHHLFTGSPDQIVDDIGVFRELGVQHLFFNFQREDMASSVRSMEEFVDRILSRVG